MAEIYVLAIITYCGIGLALVQESFEKSLEAWIGVLLWPFIVVLAIGGLMLLSVYEFTDWIREKKAGGLR